MYKYIFVILVHKIYEEGWKLAAIRGLLPTYPPALEVITKVDPRYRRTSQDMEKEIS